MATRASQCTMAFVKSTKNTHVYASILPGASILDTAYFQKSELPKTPPQRVTVTVEFEAAE